MIEGAFPSEESVLWHLIVSVEGVLCRSKLSKVVVTGVKLRQEELPAYVEGLIVEARVCWIGVSKLVLHERNFSEEALPFSH